MSSWTFYPAFVGTAISVVGWLYFAQKEHVTHLPRTLSELAAEKPVALRYYRTILWICGPLFAITLFAFILPRAPYPLLIGSVSALVIIPEILIGFFPARHGKVTIHDVIAGLMGTAMISLAYVFAWTLLGVYSTIELWFAILMTILGVLCLVNRKRYLFYELPLIFLSHFSILVAALALR